MNRWRRRLAAVVCCFGLSGPVLAAPVAAEAADQEQNQAEAAATIADEDAVLAARLRAILGAVAAFQSVQADVHAGVVVLTGRAQTGEAAQAVETMAAKLDGVLLVLNEISVEKSIRLRLRAAWDMVLQRLREAIAGLPLLLTSLVIFLLFWLLARWLRDAEGPYRFVSERALLRNLLRQSVFMAVLAAGLVAALRLMDAGALIGTVLGAAGVVGLALGFAFRNIVENYLAGILLAIRQPFRARDVVSIDGASGTVLRMTSSETTLMDADGNHLRLPNAMVFNGTVLNYTRNPLRRFTVAVGIGTLEDLDAAQDLGIATLRRMKGVIDDPAPSARIAALGDSSVLLEFYGWVDQRAASFMKVASEAHRLVKTAFDEAGVSMPAPAYSVLLEAPAGLPQAPAGVPSQPPVVESGPAPEEIDVAVADDVSEQVDKELAESEEPNLLTESATRPDR